MLSKYGVVIGQVIATTAQREVESPHYVISVDAGEDGTYEVPVNVKSIDDKRPNLLFYLDPQFDAQAITLLPTMKDGFHEINYERGMHKDIAVDYIRSGLFSPNQMEILKPYAEGPDNDLTDKIDEQMKLALNNEQATIYAFGTHYSRAKGVHNVHMNQGNTNYSPGENGTYHDGCFLLHFRDQNRWLAYFLAFQSQSWCTDEEGKPKPGSVDGRGYPVNNCKYDTVTVRLQSEDPVPVL
ncbi:YukJ family protein [Paenibacillus aurantiacus]|uniref:YukJ family protein n=1 Tax=Paenibacillus aurantiacus TaxID=1936118 RepID=A0ABV5KUE7_9BACL